MLARLSTPDLEESREPSSSTNPFRYHTFLTIHNLQIFFSLVPHLDLDDANDPITFKSSAAGGHAVPLHCHRSRESGC